MKKRKVNIQDPPVKIIENSVLKNKSINFVVIPKSEANKIVILSDKHIELIRLIARKCKKSWGITAGRILRKGMELFATDKEFSECVIAQLFEEMK